MKPSLWLALAAATVSGPALRSQPPAAPTVPPSDTARIPAPPATLHIVVSTPLGNPTGAVRLYERVAGDYEQVFRQRKWPLKIESEEFGGGPGSAPHRLELEVFVRRIRSWMPGELTYAAWTTLLIEGRKHDLGVLEFVYHPRPLEDRDQVLDNTVKGGARVTADKIEPLLFPSAR